MNSKEIIAKARKHIQSSEIDQARDLLLEHGFIQKLDAEIQKAFSKLIPITEKAEKQIMEVESGLAASDSETRKKTANWVGRQALRTWDVQRRNWMAHPRTTEALLKAMGDRDRGVAEAAMCALAWTIQRYFADLRSFEPMREFLGSENSATRSCAVAGLGRLQHARRWEALVPMLKDPSDLVREQTCGMISDAAARDEINQEARPMLIQAIADVLLLDKVKEVRTIAANAMRDMGDQSILNRLEEALKKEKANIVKERLRVAILEIQRREGQ